MAEKIGSRYRISIRRYRQGQLGYGGGGYGWAGGYGYGDRDVPDALGEQFGDDGGDGDGGDGGGGDGGGGGE